jgi:hypothetical protein
MHTNGNKQILIRSFQKDHPPGPSVYCETTVQSSPGGCCSHTCGRRQPPRRACSLASAPQSRWGSPPPALAARSRAAPEHAPWRPPRCPPLRGTAAAPCHWQAALRETRGTLSRQSSRKGARTEAMKCLGTSPQSCGVHQMQSDSVRPPKREMVD